MNRSQSIWRCCLQDRYSYPLFCGLTNSPKNPKVPNSIRYHITDIYLDELDKLEPLESADQSFAKKATQLIAPFVALRKDGLDKTAKAKAKELLEDPRLQVLKEAL
jgi:ribosomal RNA-processing protein 1